MKRINLYLLTGALMVASLGTGCKKAWFDVNKDPNNPVESNITPDLIAPYAMLNQANRAMTGFGWLGNWLGYWAPGANYAPGVEEQSYNITTTFQNGIFNGLLDNAYDYQFMQLRAKETNQTFYEGIARIMKSLNFAQLVDAYDKVPYFDALKGIEVITPKYDDGKLIYEDLIKQIDTGISLIKGAVITDNLNISTADIMFEADQTLWVKFANTLKLRLLMHQANRADRQAYITAEVAKIVAEGTGFLGSRESAEVNPAFQADKPNAFYASYGFNQVGEQATDFWRANRIALDLLKINFDTVRMKLFYKPKVGIYTVGGVQKPITDAAVPFPEFGDTSYRGNRYGLPIDNNTYPVQVASYVSQIGGVKTAGAATTGSQGLVKGYNQNAWILPSVESLFLQAEAIERGYLAGDKVTAYKNAVRESFIWLNAGGSPVAAIAAFEKFYDDEAGDPDIDYAAAPNKLNLLFFQKYLGTIGVNNFETWVDYRRNGTYPYIELSANPGRTSLVMPVRLLYPQSEININPNVPSLGKNSGDQFTGKIWWMP